MRFCDFCGEPSLLTVESKPTARVICSRCVWRCVEKMAEHQRHPERFEELDQSALSEQRS